MTDFLCVPGQVLRGHISVPGDKSISHRFVMLASIAHGRSTASNLLTGEDCISTVNAFRSMGVNIKLSGTCCVVDGVGKNGLKAPKEPLFLGNSGTTMRLLSGLLAGQGFDVTLEGDESLAKRPMDRVVLPLRAMEAHIYGIGERINPPLQIKSSRLHGATHVEKLGSAQVKSSLLLAGLYAEGTTTVIEKKRSRDHTERMFDLFGARFTKEGNILKVDGTSSLDAVDDLLIPGDISSAAFFIVAGLIIPGSGLVIRDVCLNPTRIGILDVLKQMGAHIEIKVKRSAGEPCGDISVRHSKLRAVTVSEDRLPFLIDEIPILMVACAFAQGQSCIMNASELRVKETDRIESMATGLRALGAEIAIENDTITIMGKTQLQGDAEVESYDDHRTAMSLIVAGLASEKAVTVKNTGCIAISYPDFVDDLRLSLGA
ncbi:MAG: 3-phosphoshikimate 1-carboxyvinyltransferase [Candidatus Omnitrophica bacterium]|nr:3-phosphoshikimate 1-carboxyvinyltransferase [Candidatus Omnitrophota bacterium]